MHFNCLAGPRNWQGYLYFLKTMLERRQHKRFKVNKDTFVFSKAHPGRINDISMGGMAFSHFSSNDECQGIESLSLFDKENDFFLEDVSCRTIGNSISRSSLPFSVMKTAQKSVEFSLSPSQAIQLQRYLQFHSCGHV